MSKKTDIWMPLYIGDYLRDTNRLTTEQHGAYLLLIMDYWVNGAPPDVDSILAQICRLDANAWSIAKLVIKPFFTITDGKLTHPRIDREIQDARTKKLGAVRKAEAAAKQEYIAGEVKLLEGMKKRLLEKASYRRIRRSRLRYRKARWDNRDASSITSSNSRSMLEDCPSPSPSPDNTNSKALVVAKADNVPFGKIVDLYHQALPVLPRVADLSAKRKALVRARWQGIKPESVDDGLNEFKCFFDIVSKSKFLTGQSTNGGGRPFRANFEWLMNESNYLKVIEGNYHA